MIQRKEYFQSGLGSIDQLRTKSAHVHSITNTVAQNFTANILLACGATVSMTANPDEIAGFVKKADALHVNLGTLDPERMKAIRIALSVAEEKSIPIILDPVMVHMSGLRAEFAREIAKSASIIRGNASEMEYFDNSKQSETCFITTGATDTICYQNAIISVANGDRIMDRVIATGCALGALVAALSTRADNPMVAGLAALIWYGVAGEVAAEKVKGPGSFIPEFLDSLYAIETATIAERAQII
ncbi:MAG: hydroxyethylthiazole kinase [Pseudomonadota bacterium]